MLNLCYYYFHSYKYTLYVVQWLKPILDIFLSHDIPKAKLFHVFCFLQSTIYNIKARSDDKKYSKHSKCQKISVLMKTY